MQFKFLRVFSILLQQIIVNGLDNGLALTPPMGWLAWERSVNSCKILHYCETSSAFFKGFDVTQTVIETQRTASARSCSETWRTWWRVYSIRVSVAMTSHLSGDRGLAGGWVWVHHDGRLLAQPPEDRGGEAAARSWEVPLRPPCPGELLPQTGT